MEKISHRITLDVHKGGIQKVLHGMFTGDVLSRKIVISLVAGSAVCNMDENTAAVMYVTKPSGVTNYGACTVEGNLVTYDILPADIDEPGITQMQLKVVSGDMVLYAPMFSVEAQKNSSSDTPAETSPQFSALEQALAQVEEVYQKRIVAIDIEEDYTFVVTYADGETYESDAFKGLMEAIETAEHERAEAEVARDVAEENRELAESEREGSYSAMKNDIQSAIDANTALYNRVEELADEGLITESRVVEIIEEQGGGGGGGTVVLPDNVLVASDVTAAEAEAPKINADLFGSLPPSDYAKTSDVEGITDGSTQVGNAKTLDGHGAEYFVERGEALNTSILEKAVTLDTGMHNFVLGGSGYTGEDLPNTQYAYGIATVNKRGSNGITVLLWATRYVLPLIYNQYNGTKWIGWKEMFTTDGGTIANATSKPLALKNTTDGATSAFVEFVGSDTLGRIGYNGVDNPVVYSSTLGTRPILHTGNMADYVLPKSGGAVTAETTPIELISTNTKNETRLKFTNSSTVLGWLMFSGVDNPAFRSTGNTVYPLLHTGNKPTGTYTGNGSATERVIDVGGIGDTLRIKGTNGYSVLVDYNGAWGVKSDGTAVSLGRADCYFESGKLVLKTTNSIVNNNASTFTWRLL